MQPRVKIYTLSTCSHCNATKRFLNENRIKYEFADVDLLSDAEQQRILDEVRRLNPNCTFPTIMIDNKVIIGFREKELSDILGL